MSASGDYLPVGRISGVFGVHGWLKIFSYTEPRHNILNYSPWYLLQDGQWVAHELIDGQSHGKGVVARLAAASDRDRAAALVGTEIAISRQQLPVLQDNEYYWRDLEGMRVLTPRGEELGVVDYLFETGSNDVMVVAGERERLIPFIRDEVVVKVDKEQGVIVVDWDVDF